MVFCAESEWNNFETAVRIELALETQISVYFETLRASLSDD